MNLPSITAMTYDNENFIAHLDTTEGKFHAIGITTTEWQLLAEQQDTVYFDTARDGWTAFKVKNGDRVTTLAMGQLQRKKHS